eukprot:CAMPEP_0195337460 /NCGR_PEP_ID=MMETSP0708-20121125/16919_1 /TAXON_ID=33640 /ORGANISM="Asterionellopsis glacialis, Strain CCMP134" /LENGTH=94 /DNA_ID=CAMNT_0040408479 /DNA_START=457 /DNA_END=741 /DNA_ORIENTATION=-
MTAFTPLAMVLKRIEHKTKPIINPRVKETALELPPASSNKSEDASSMRPRHPVSAPAMTLKKNSVLPTKSSAIEIAVSVQSNVDKGPFIEILNK